MAFPAEKPFSVRAQIYLRRVLSGSFLRMTAAAEFPRFRFRRRDAPRADLMLRRNSVARRTTDQRMRRRSLDAGDLSMAGRALPRSLGRHRIMRVVTSRTGLERIVDDRIDLRKAGRP